MRAGLTTLAFGLCCSLPTSMAQAATITHKALGFENWEYIEIDGDIVSGDLERFRQISLRYPQASVGLNSDGGLTLPAIEIGKIIRERGYGTVVGRGDTCASACALIWAAGEPRSLFKGGHIGFHAAYLNNNGKPEESGVANALVGNYLTLLGFSQKAIVFATAAGPKDMRWLTESNKTLVGIDFDLWEDSSSEDLDAPDVSKTPSPPPLVAANNGQSASLAREPRPLTDPAGWVSWEDFPYKALGVKYENLSPDMSLSVRYTLDVDGRVRQGGVISAVAVGHRQAALAVMCRG